jgi:lipopolysaccharide biosynthesis glycosyltransferase
MLEAMLIFTGADGNYALQTQVWLLSLVKTQRTPVRVVVFGNCWSDKDFKIMKSLENDLVKIDLREVDTADFSGVRLKNGFPLATVYNVLAPLYLLSNESRAVYMDADMVVTEDLSALWEMQLRFPVGAVLDAHIVWMASPSMWRPWREEGLEPLTPYLNTGLMMMDLDRWRTEKLTERTLIFLEKYELPCVDQDALNLVLRGEFDQLHPRYNSMPYHHLKMLRYLDTVESDKIIGEAITNPAVIHYHRSFFGKPWTYWCSHPGANLWKSLADQVQPGWQKEFDLVATVRAFAANKAKMMLLDSRTARYRTDLLQEKS